MGRGTRVLSMPTHFTVILNQLGGTSVWGEKKSYLPIIEQVTFKSQPDENLGCGIREYSIGKYGM